MTSKRTRHTKQTRRTGLSAHCPNANCRRAWVCHHKGPGRSCLGIDGLTKRVVSMGYRFIDRHLAALMKQSEGAGPGAQHIDEARGILDQMKL